MPCRALKISHLVFARYQNGIDSSMCKFRSTKMMNPVFRSEASEF